MVKVARGGRWSVVAILLASLGTLPTRASAGAVVDGFTASALAKNDDGSSGAVPLGFTVNFFGSTHTTVFVNNNGNITFDSALSTYTPFNITSTARKIIAVFFADIDTRSAGQPVKYGTGTVNGFPAFGVNYVDVDYYSGSASHTRRTSCQLLLIGRADTGAGNFDIWFNYDKVQWESGTASGGSPDGLGGTSVRVGYSNGTGAAGTFFELAGSSVPGSFLDSNTTTGLIHNSLNTNVQGRYIFQVRGGAIVNPPIPTSIAPNTGPTAGGTAVTITGSNFQAGATVTLGGVAAQNITVVNATTITATTASHNPGSVDVVVANPDGQSGNLNNGYTYTGPVTTVDPTPGAPDPCLLCYLAEGATGTFFDLNILIANPNATSVPVKVTFLRPVGAPVELTMTLPATSRKTILVDEIAGLESTAVSAVVESLNLLPLVVERTMFWDADYYGGHSERAVGGPRTDWYFAEGSQGFFDTYVLLVNPNDTVITATVKFLTEANGTITDTIQLQPNSRQNVYAGNYPALVNKSFGLTVTFSQPAVAERSMYFGSRLFDGGHNAVGAAAPATNWFFAEGATGEFFDTYILVANPNGTAANVRFTFLLPDGNTIVKDRVVNADSRTTLNIEWEDARLQNTAVSTLVTSDLPVVSERAMYWPGPPTTWAEAHDSFGANAPGTRWGLAEGRAGGPRGFETYILLANPNGVAANVTITYLLTDGTTRQAAYTVGANSRFNVPAGFFTPELQGREFGAIIDANVPISVERAMYWNSQGVLWAGGSDALATRLQ